MVSLSLKKKLFFFCVFLAVSRGYTVHATGVASPLTHSLTHLNTAYIFHRLYIGQSDSSRVGRSIIRERGNMEEPLISFWVRGNMPYYNYMGGELDLMGLESAPYWLLNWKFWQQKIYAQEKNLDTRNMNSVIRCDTECFHPCVQKGQLISLPSSSAEASSLWMLEADSDEGISMYAAPVASCVTKVGGGKKLTMVCNGGWWH